MDGEGEYLSVGSSVRGGAVFLVGWLVVWTIGCVAGVLQVLRRTPAAQRMGLLVRVTAVRLVAKGASYLWAGSTRVIEVRSVAM